MKTIKFIDKAKKYIMLILNWLGLPVVLVLLLKKIENKTISNIY